MALKLMIKEHQNYTWLLKGEIPHRISGRVVLVAVGHHEQHVGLELIDGDVLPEKEFEMISESKD